jgi:hypothetical protein
MGHDFENTGLDIQDNIKMYGKNINGFHLVQDMDQVMGSS